MDNYDDSDNGQSNDLLAAAKYRTLGICKALGIERERFRDWVKARPGFIKPTLPAMGQGTKAGFTLGDVYAIALFKRMTETGFKRELAADIVANFMGIFPGNPIQSIQYLICIVKTNPENGEQDTMVFMTMRGDERDTLDVSINSKTMNFDNPLSADCSGWEGMFMFNIIQLRQSVDSALEKAGLW